MHKLIVKECTLTCALTHFRYAHYFGHYFLTMFITPKHLKLSACGGLLGSFVNNPLEGYRTLVPIKITQNPSTQKNPRQGGTEKGEI